MYNVRANHRRVTYMLKSRIVQKVFQRLVKANDFVKELSKKTEIAYPLLLFDMVFSRLCHVELDEYAKYRFYEKSYSARDQFITEHRRWKLDKKFNHDITLMRDKPAHYRLLSGLLGRQWLYTPDASDQQIEEFLKTHQQIIVKPGSSWGGIGVQKVLNSEVADIKTFCESARKNCFLLEEVIKQHPDLSSLNPTSVNTLRVHTVMDKAGVPHILCAALRMGKGKSINDNFESGGLGVQIDLDSGIVFTLAVGKDLQTVIKHPTSGVVLPGFQIPHWEAAKEMALCASNKVSPTISRWIGWDIAIAEKGPLVIEGNTAPGINTVQVPSQKGLYHLLKSYL